MRQCARPAALRCSPRHLMRVASRLTAAALLTLALPGHRRSLASIQLCANAVEPPTPQALEAALGTERAAEVWARRPAGTLPNEKKQAALVEWLQTGPLAVDPERFLYPCLRREPKLWLRAASLPALRETHAQLSKLLRESAAPVRFANAIANEPALLLAAADAHVEAFNNLTALTGLDSSSLARVLQREVCPLRPRSSDLWSSARLDPPTSHSSHPCPPPPCLSTGGSPTGRRIGPAFHSLRSSSPLKSP